jgi:hypothetical protein
MVSNATFVISPEVLAQEVHGEIVLLDLEGEAYFGLNAVGARVWQLLREQKDIAQILDHLEGEFDVSRAQLEVDLPELLDTLVRAGLVRET